MTKMEAPSEPYRTPAPEPPPDPSCFHCDSTRGLTACKACGELVCYSCQYGKGSPAHGFFHMYGRRPNYRDLVEEIEELRFDLKRWMYLSAFVTIVIVVFTILAALGHISSLPRTPGHP